MKRQVNRQIWVVKVGSSLVTNNGCGIDRQQIASWAKDIAALKEQGIDTVLVSSGSIAEGLKRLAWSSRPKALNELQAAAAVGQMGLAYAYEEAFHSLGLLSAQVLLTHEDLSNRTRYLNARSTLRTLLAMNIVPVVNENDTVTTSEIKLGDNDTLGALVANLLEADDLIILTDQEGLYTADPRHHKDAQLIKSIDAHHPSLEKMAGGAGSAVGTGGMFTKVKAAQRAALSGAKTTILSGKKPGVLCQLAKGVALGTVLVPTQSRIKARQQWLMGQLRLSGYLTVDEGAVSALSAMNSSLLPIGCVALSGDFLRGEAVAVVNADGQEIARGLVNYSSAEIARLLKKPSAQIEALLGYVAEEELIHRDNMVLQAAFSSNSDLS